MEDFDLETDDPNIMNMDFKIYHNIKLLLDDRSIREAFLEVLPRGFFSIEMYQMMERGTKSPGEWLLEYLGNRGGRVSDLINLFQEINLERALIYLRREEPLQIIEQPEPNINVNEGERFSITCRASGYPHPEYQWFKDNEELLLEGQQDLLISPAKVEDSGIYVCQVSKINADSSNSCLLSDPATVVVSPCKYTNLAGPSKQNSEKKQPSSIRADVESIETESTKLYVQNILSKKCSESEKIVIKKQPQSWGEIPQGSTPSFTCIAKASHPVNYQWFKNGQLLDGQTSTRLYVDELYPDPVTGKKEFKFVCKVYNEYGEILSDDAVVKLEEENDRTRYVAEEKIAFLVANDKYEAYEEDLDTPAFDVVDLTKLLKSIDFKVIVFRNLNLREMRRAFQFFCTLLRPGSYAVVFFAGHGFEHLRQTYLQPIDCSENLVPEESMCAEHILQQLQETNPALIVLFIDACRRLPSELGNVQTEIIEAPMRDNTVYGYATSFLNGAYESPERNSFFVKHLKKYITHDKSIQNIILLVQRDVKAEPLIRNIQNPVLHSSLCYPRKLRDELRNPLDMTTRQLPYWFYQESNVIEKQTQIIPGLKCYFIIEIKDHMDVYLNGLDVNLYIYVKEDADLDKLRKSGLSVVLFMPSLQVSRGVGLHNAPFDKGARNLIIKEEVLELQRFQDAEINAQLVVKIRRHSIPIDLSFTAENIRSMHSFFRDEA